MGTEERGRWGATAVVMLLATAACSDDSTAGGDGGQGGGAASGGMGGDAAAGGDGGGGAQGGQGGEGGEGGGGGATGMNRVFVTSTKHDGMLGGLVGGDAFCQELADGEGLGGTWMAWLGDGTDGPATRFNQSTTPYRLVSGETVAQDWADLIDGTIEVPLNHDETGEELPSSDDMIVFTAVFHTGGNPTPVNCMGWTDASDNLVPTGLATATDTGWTVTAPHLCSETHHFYCFEQ
jgi:hypothetical protein